MKTVFRIFIVMFLMMVTAISTVYAQSSIFVAVNGDLVNFPDQQPVIVDGRALVPVRGVFEMLGFSAAWDADKQVATLSRGNEIVMVRANYNFFITGTSTKHSLDVPAKIINGRMMIPLRAISEATGSKVEWDAENSLAIITGSIPDYNWSSSGNNSNNNNNQQGNNFGDDTVDIDKTVSKWCDTCLSTGTIVQLPEDWGGGEIMIPSEGGVGIFDKCPHR